MMRRVKDLDEVVEFVWQLSQNKLYASYPRLNSKAEVQKEIEKAIKLENFNIIAFYNKNELSGVCSYFWIDDERYAQTTIFTIGEGYKNVVGKFVDYMSKELPGYELFIGVPSTNKNINEYFKEKGIKCVENSIVTKICNLRPYSNKRYKFVQEIQENNFEEYALFHDRYAVSNEMYYNSKNLYKEIGGFRIFVYKQDDEIYGSIFVKVGKEISDVIGLFIDKKYENKDIESILINQMLASLYNEFGSIRELLYFIDKDSVDELDIALRAGFEIKEEYRLFKCIF